MSVEFKEVSFSYGKNYDNAIYNINLKVNNMNEFIAILGHTGSGKSTLMQHINGLILPKDGFIKIFDKTITKKKRTNPKMKEIRKRIGYVFQFPEYQLFEDSVLKDIMFGPLNFGLSQEEAKDNALKYADILGITDLLDKSPFELSGGQMRKVAICGVLAYEPDIILLDEPTRGLDPKAAYNIMEIFRRLNKEYNKSIIMISHDMDITYEYANRIVVLQNGAIVYDGDKYELFKESDYEKYHLSKPLIVDLENKIQNTLNIKMNTKCCTLDDLLESLKGVL